MEQAQTTPAPPCPYCGEDGSKRTLKSLRTPHGELSVLSDAHSIMGSEIFALVCKSCGYVQLFTNPQDFE